MTPEEVFVPVASQLQSVMVHPLTANNIEFKSATALLIGPGMAAEGLHKDIKEKTDQIWHDSPMPMLVDASALDWLTAGEITSKSIRVITPHPGEAARLLECTAADIQADREKALQALSAKFGNCWVILKGRHTLVGQSKGIVFVNPTGNSLLGQGGSGDLLAGYIAGLLAQPLLQENVVKTLSYGIWQHGAAADKLNDSKLNWTIEDLSQQIGGTKP
jgi:NAD(P)H-hydrate epimerase